MSKLTKSQLIDQLVALRAQYEVLETQLEYAEYRLDTLAAQPAPAAPATSQRPAYIRTAYTPSAAQMAFRAKCAAAKAAAMAQGRSVAVA